jgi:hypothetical protein
MDNSICNDHCAKHNKSAETYPFQPILTAAYALPICGQYMLMTTYMTKTDSMKPICYPDPLSPKKDAYMFIDGFTFVDIFLQRIRIRLSSFLVKLRPPKGMQPQLHGHLIFLTLISCIRSHRREGGRQGPWITEFPRQPELLRTAQFESIFGTWLFNSRVDFEVVNVV